MIYGDDTALDRTGTRSTCIERTAGAQNVWHSKRLEMLEAACAWDDVVYNLTRNVKTLRLEINVEDKRWLPYSPAMAAGLTDHIWSIRDLLMRALVPTNSI